jgi:hypothetical protein
MSGINDIKKSNEASYLLRGLKVGVRIFLLASAVVGCTSFLDQPSQMTTSYTPRIMTLSLLYLEGASTPARYPPCPRKDT